MPHETVKINERTWRIEDSGVRVFLLAGDEKALLIDTGMNLPDAAEIARELTDLPLELLNTHADRDHISGNSSFDSFYMSPNEEANYRSAGGMGTIIPVSQGDTIDLGGRVLEIVDLPGHTPGSIAVIDPECRALISGDPIQDGRIFMFGKYRDLNKYVGSLKALSAFDGRYDEIWPSHGSFPVSPSIVSELITAAESILAGSAEGKKADLFGNTITEYTTPPAVFLCD
ncbi:MAG: MBL fold metallo-hydrolase [Oscillospiraceae bacterium]|nr:MBL fold metallo-hydrolase [Oscillospiraceae bacterium]